MTTLPQKCRSNLLPDQPANVDEFGSHQRVANAIFTLINDETGGKAIALIGCWGSGKSTVVELIRKNFQDRLDSHIFLFDAWAHQGDPLRRTFLEQQIESLQQVGWLKAPEWKATLERLARKLRITETKKTPTITKGQIWSAFSVILAGIGAILASKSTAQINPI